MEEYLAMKIRKVMPLFAPVLLVALMALPAQGERISLKFSYGSNNISGTDINTWIDSFNQLWADWKTLNNGDLQGQFAPIDFSGGLEFGLRIPLYKGLALNLAASRYSSSSEGAVSLQYPGGTQFEEQLISNKVTAWPIKVGLSYSLALPPLPRLALVAGFGRHIVLATYNTVNNYKAQITDLGQDFLYLINRQNKYSSEGLGYYAHLGAEFDIIQYIAVFVEGEKIWNTLDGFKGNFTYEALGFPSGDIRQNGKASLYFYESDQNGTGTYYALMTGHKDKPEGRLDWPLDGGPIEGPQIKNLRQGELDFNHISFKIGIRFKF
jgi:hypothetical protein